MISVNDAGCLIVTKHQRTTVIQKMDAQAGVTALIRLGYGVDVAQVFGNGAERDRVIELARRKGALQ